MIIQGDALTELRKMDSESINCVVTSPPYWGLRKYDIPDLIWDSQDGCEHEWGMESKKSNRWGGIQTMSDKQASNFGAYQTAGDKALSQGQFCLSCSAWRGQLGLEPTIDLYLSHLLQIFKEVWRVLRKDGTVWINIGDSYSGSHGTGGNPGDKQYTQAGSRTVRSRPGIQNGLKPKDLCLIPFRLALALQADGWWVRSDIIWAKSNPMPESVRDRPTRSHEYVFLLTKSQHYFFDQDAVRLPPSHISGGLCFGGIKKGKDKRQEGIRITGREFTQEERDRYMTSGANIRSVWNIPTQSYPEAHYATFPEELVERCIKAGCQKGGTVLDPFAGSGTVIRVAERLQRQGIGIDLGYQELQEKRTKNNQIELLIG